VEGSEKRREKSRPTQWGTSKYVLFIKYYYSDKIKENRLG
jgi:hypothetical protein